VGGILRGLSADAYYSKKEKEKSRMVPTMPKQPEKEKNLETKRLAQVKPEREVWNNDNNDPQTEKKTLESLKPQLRVGKPFRPWQIKQGGSTQGGAGSRKRRFTYYALGEIGSTG